jgi:hypothetical protein
MNPFVRRITPRGWVTVDVPACTPRVRLVHTACGRHSVESWEFSTARDELGERRRMRAEWHRMRRTAHAYARAHSCTDVPAPSTHGVTRGRWRWPGWGWRYGIGWDIRRYAERSTLGRVAFGAALRTERARWAVQAAERAERARLAAIPRPVASVPDYRCPRCGAAAASGTVRYQARKIWDAISIYELACPEGHPFTVEHDGD